MEMQLQVLSGLDDEIGDRPQWLEAKARREEGLYEENADQLVLPKDLERFWQCIRSMTGATEAITLESRRKSRVQVVPAVTPHLDIERDVDAYQLRTAE